MFPIIDFNAELVFDRVMDQHTRLDVHLVVLVVPMRLESDRNTVPSVRVNVPQSITANLDDALCKHVWLLVQVHMVLVWVVERAHYAHGSDWVQAKSLFRHLLDK